MGLAGTKPAVINYQCYCFLFNSTRELGGFTLFNRNKLIPETNITSLLLSLFEPQTHTQTQRRT